MDTDLEDYPHGHRQCNDPSTLTANGSFADLPQGQSKPPEMDTVSFYIIVCNFGP